MPKIPLDWLEESVTLVPGSTGADVAAALVKVGLEEEGIDGGEISGPLVVGRVMSLVKEAQSNGKTINYCRVDVGEHNDPAGPGHKPDNKVEYPSSRGIVCGAHNFVEGDLVVVVLPGGVLPGPFPIGGRKTYGHWSDGMICSAKELGLGEDHDGIIVLRHADGTPGLLPADIALEPGMDAIPLLDLDKETIEINVTPDRGYSFSIRGVAREYSHSTGQPFTDAAGTVEIAGTAVADAGGSSAFPILIEDAAPIRGTVGCDRFAALRVTGFDPAAESPGWMKRRLTAAGMRPISLAVDVTNYVMLELGQPLHAYDLDHLVAPIVVRRANPGEKLVTLDDAGRVLDAEDLVISDSEGGHAARAIGVAGVMGGASTEVSETTTNILLEGAHFDPITVARSARRHKLPSEASRRFERGVDTVLGPIAVHRAAQLLVEFGGGEIESVYTDVNATTAPAPLTTTVDFPGRIIGIDIPADEVVASLELVGCVVERDGDNLTVTPPTWRPDMDAAITLVEEVGRLRGYDNLPSVVPVAPPGRGYTHAQKVRRQVARTLAESGLTEVITYPWMSEQRLLDMRAKPEGILRDTIKLANPLSAEQPYLRTSVLATLLDALKVNLSRGAKDVGLFEVGRAYRASTIGDIPAYFEGGTITPEDVAKLDEALPQQARRVAGIMTGDRVPTSWRGKGEPYDWSDAIQYVKRAADVVDLPVTVQSGDAGAAEAFHPGRVAQVWVGDTAIGVAGEIHPKVLETLGLPARTVAFEVDLDAIVAASEGVFESAVPVSQQVLAKEDFAFVVDAPVTAADLTMVVTDAGGDLVEDAHVFDVYEGEQIGEGKKSLAIAVTLRAADHTLSGDEVLAVREAIVAAAGERLGAELR